ncbi:MAG: hypothetical protein NVSMB51_01300 [Solirubrobacteraceae bacterium]
MRLGRAVQTLAVMTASDCLSAGQLTIVDVRGDAEFAQGHIPGAMHIPLGQLRQRLREVRSDRPIAFVCRSGHRSALAARNAARHRPDVSNIDGGMSAWVAAGLPTAGRQATERNGVQP